MAKDDPQELLALANRLRTHADEYDGPDENVRDVLRELAVFICPPQDPEPEIPPGELVLVGGEYLQITSNEGLRWTGGVLDDDQGTITRIASSDDVKKWAQRYYGSSLKAFKHLARLVVSQEQPPELIGGDEDVFTVPERRFGKTGEYCFDAVTGRVFYIQCDTVIPAWIVTKK